MTAPSDRAPSRLPPISPGQYTTEQQAAADEFLDARHTAPFGPFELLLYSPEVMTRTRAMGDYLRYRSAIGNRLSELAILVTAHEWQQDFEWQIHYPIALDAGIPKEVADAIGAGRRPERMSSDEESVYDFSIELHRQKQVSDATWHRVESRFGRKGVVDLTAINGYYAFLAMQMNMACYQGPAAP
jgi:4-carboxymuconolactone decarboxylase